MRRTALVATFATLAALGAAGWTSGSAAADENTDAAESQFLDYLATNTGLIALDVTCAPLPDSAPSGPMICYALLSDRQIASAVAELEAAGVYRFITINKIEAQATGGSPTAEAGSADAAVVATIQRVVAPDSRLSAMVLMANPDITSVDNVSFFDPTGTVEIAVTTSAANDNVRHAIAFAVTEVLSGMWAEGQPLRDPAATIQPRVEVTVDGTLYSSAYGMMTAIADGTMPYSEWLELAGVPRFESVGAIERRVDAKRQRH